MHTHTHAGDARPAVHLVEVSERCRQKTGDDEQIIGLMEKKKKKKKTTLKHDSFKFFMNFDKIKLFLRENDGNKINSHFKNLIQFHFRLVVDSIFYVNKNSWNIFNFRPQQPLFTINFIQHLPKINVEKQKKNAQSSIKWVVNAVKSKVKLLPVNWPKNYWSLWSISRSIKSAKRHFSLWKNFNTRKKKKAQHQYIRLRLHLGKKKNVLKFSATKKRGVWSSNIIGHAPFTSVRSQSVVLFVSSHFRPELQWRPLGG